VIYSLPTKSQLFLEKQINLCFYISMNSKDIKINHHYRLEIWDKEYNYLHCIAEDDGWFIMASFHMEEPMMIMNDDNEMDGLIEIAHDEYHKWEALWEWKYKHQPSSPPEDPNPYADYEALFENC